MKLFLTKLFEKDYTRLSTVIQKQCDKQLLALLKNPRHPSLRARKIQGVKNIWEGRITKSYRFTFQIIEGVYVIRRIGKHNEALKRP